MNVAPEFLRDDLGHPKQCFLFESLCGADDNRSALDVRGGALEDAARAVSRRSRHDNLGPGQRLFQAVCDPQTVGEAHVGQIDGVSPARTHVRDERRIAPPQPRVVSTTSEMDGQCGSPPARTEYSYAIDIRRLPRVVPYRPQSVRCCCDGETG